MFYCSFVSIHYIICDCGETFPTEEELKKHHETEHVSMEDYEILEYKCATCEKVFSSEKACLIHQRFHIKPKVKFEVDEFGEALPPKKNKQFRSKNIICEICGKVYASNAALRYHQRVHTGERPYHCSLCPKSFTMPLFLQIHIRTHTGERPYPCPHCPKAFSNKAALLRHDRVHTGIKPYECPKCGKTFTQSNSMKLHVKTVHLKMPAPYKSKTRRNKEAMRHAALNNIRVQFKIEDNLPQVKTEHQTPEDEDDEEQYTVEEYNEAYQEEMYQNVKVEQPEVAMYSEDPEMMYEEVYVSVEE